MNQRIIKMFLMQNKINYSNDQDLMILLHQVTSSRFVMYCTAMMLNEFGSCVRNPIC